MNEKCEYFVGGRFGKLQTHRRVLRQPPSAAAVRRPRLPSGMKGSAPRVRSQCRFALPLIHFIPDALRDSVPLFLKRQCDRTLRPDRRLGVLAQRPEQGREGQRIGLHMRYVSPANHFTSGLRSAARPNALVCAAVCCCVLYLRYLRVICVSMCCACLPCPHQTGPARWTSSPSRARSSRSRSWSSPVRVARWHSCF